MPQMVQGQPVYDPEELGFTPGDLWSGLRNVAAAAQHARGGVTANGQPTFLQQHGAKLAILGGAAAVGLAVYYATRARDDDDD